MDSTIYFVMQIKQVTVMYIILTMKQFSHLQIIISDLQIIISDFAHIL